MVEWGKISFLKEKNMILLGNFIIYTMALIPASEIIPSHLLEEVLMHEKIFFRQGPLMQMLPYENSIIVETILPPAQDPNLVTHATEAGQTLERLTRDGDGNP